VTRPDAHTLEAPLVRVPLFAALPPDACLALAARMRRRTLPAGAAVIYRGDMGGTLYVVLSGCVKVHTATENGGEVLLTIKGPGDFFGEMSLLDGLPRAADVSTLEPTTLALLDGVGLRDMMTARPALAWEMMRTLVGLLRAQNAQVELLMTQDVAGRVAGLLLTLAQKRGTLLDDGKHIRIDVALTQADIAASVGATRERVSRALSGFRAQHAIARDKASGHWTVLNPAILDKRAQS